MTAEGTSGMKTKVHSGDCTAGSGAGLGEWVIERGQEDTKLC